ncbi:hypothetical protein KIH27_18600 [Mycobacterium sp. M1]|uniref:Transposase n=1 Tax=Mycolicibacter acidiphilus TaxID=2835306 RepID=A0ABS5RMS4_9MYCO|nr:hypothetical protein [Mycolicibacter acidiphilus]MBS9535600.1 hypothetical protein [Mycolicibacter acidiphilus]
MKTKKPSRQQLDALAAVAEGRVEWGHEYQEMARRRGGRGAVYSFIIDGAGAYAGQHATFGRLSELGWITERIDLLPTKVLPAETRTVRGLSGDSTVELPEREAPADDGWRAKVELTDEGRTILAAAAVRGRYDLLADTVAVSAEGTLGPGEVPWA